MKNLVEKMKDKRYIEKLSDRSRNELIAAISVLDAQELSKISSISVAYKIARHKWIKMNLPETKWEEYIEGKPLFWKSYITFNKLQSKNNIDYYGTTET